MTAAEALQPAIVYLGAGLAVAFAARALRTSPIVGYLCVGVLIGPYGLGLVQDNETTHFLAELGVAFMLFDIGLHFSLREIRTRRQDILGLAPIQLLLCGGVFAAINAAFGYRLEIALIVGASIALSSTAVVGRILADRNQPSCPIGRAATAVLVAQDIAAIFILAVAASITVNPENVGRDLALAMLWALVALVVAVLAARYVIRPLFRSLALAHNEEAFTVVALLIVLSASASTAAVGLSLTLGAFLAGMAMSDTPYRHVVQSEMKPFQGLLLGLFFISVGMQVNLPEILGVWPVVVLVAAGILVIKTLLVFVAARLSRWSSPGAAQLAFLLSQGSEFTLVVIGIAGISAGMGPFWTGVLVSAITLTLAAAAPWSALGVRAARWLAERTRADPAPEADPDLPEPVIIFGMTEETRLAADALSDHEIPYQAIESDPERFVAAVSDGYHVVYGDPRDPRLLRTMGVGKSPAVLLGGASQADLPFGERQADAAVPKRFAAAASPHERARLHGLGFRAHVAHADPKGIELAADLLAELGVEHARIAAWISDQAERRGLIETAEDIDAAVA
jgi:monovalent cation:proton antiporter-2 (CPA2) family protein